LKFINYNKIIIKISRIPNLILKLFFLSSKRKNESKLDYGSSEPFGYRRRGREKHLLKGIRFETRANWANRGNSLKEIQALHESRKNS